MESCIFLTPHFLFMHLFNLSPVPFTQQGFTGNVILKAYGIALP